MPVFSLLADPRNYEPCSTGNMLNDPPFLTHWATHFEHHFETVMRLALDQYGPDSAPRVEACKNEFISWVRKVHATPHQLSRLDLLIFDGVRQEILIKHELPDPFEKTKSRENEAALPIYPRIVAELDSHPKERERLLLAIEGVFAGNIFDLGAGATTKMFANKSPDFLAVRDSLGGKRPWLVDHFEAMADRLLQPAGTQPRHRQAMFFCDNAGTDLILGVMPLCRLLAKRGTRVIIAANTLPALNDITAGELRTLLPRLCTLDPTLKTLVDQGMIQVINSGGVAPLIDLRELSEDVNHHAKDTDLLFLEGMGRALESNYDARFKVDTIKLAMIKDESVAEKLGGKNFDTVCRFDPA